MTPVRLEDRTCPHVVCLYDSDEELLTRDACSFLAGGLRDGGRCVIIATPRHERLFLTELASRGVDVEEALSDRWIVSMDADRLAEQLLQADETAFERLVGENVRDLLTERQNGVRIFGEIVGILWDQGRYDAAKQLETMWNEFLARVGVKLFCAYPIGVLGHRSTIERLSEVIAAHDVVVSCRHEHRMTHALQRGLDDVLGVYAQTIRPLIKRQAPDRWPNLPEAEATVVWLRTHLPARSEEIIELARRYFEEAVS